MIRTLCKSIRSPPLRFIHRAVDDVKEIIDPDCDPYNPKTLDFDRIVAARENIKGSIFHISCERSRFLSQVAKCDVFLKMENRQQTGTFKDRGARNALMCLNEEERKKGVYVASTGSFGRAVAYHGKELGIPVTVVLTRFASMTTLTHCLNYGAQVVVEGISHVESSEAALRLALNNGGKFINGHDNLDSMAGAGTVAVEILEEVPDLDAIFVPVGGAGLFAATVVAVKAMSPKTKVIGLEAQTCPALMRALKEGRPIVTQNYPSCADALAVRKVGCNAFYTVKDSIDGVVAVREGGIALGILKMFEEEKTVLEGAGAIGPAAILQRSVRGLEGRRIACILTGGNIDITALGRAIEKGLALDVRLTQVKTIIDDKPGAFAEYFGVFRDNESNLVDAVTETIFHRLDAQTGRCKVIADIAGEDHMIQVNEAVVAKYGRRCCFTMNHRVPRINV